MTVTDNCDPNPAVVFVPPSGSRFPTGTTNVVCTATDACGNVARCQFTVTVRDTEPPQVSCLEIVADIEPGQCSVSGVTFSATAIDNCGVTHLAYDVPSGSTFPAGVSTVRCTATDASGNSSSTSFTVTIRESEPPEIFCPESITLDLRPGESCKSNVTFKVMAWDRCGGVTVTSTPPSGAIFPKGQTVVCCTATDACGNTNLRTFSVTVRDPLDPDPCGGAYGNYAALDLGRGVSYGLRVGASAGDQEMILAQAGPAQDRRWAVRPAMDDGTPGHPHHFLNFALLQNTLGPSSQPNAFLAVCVTYYDDPSLRGATFGPEAYTSERNHELTTVIAPATSAVTLEGSGQWRTAYFELPDTKFYGVNQLPQAAARFLLSDKIFFTAVRYAVVRTCGPLAGVNLLEPWKTGAPPRLNFTELGNKKLALSWPLHPQGYFLESSPDLSAGSWSFLPASAQLQQDTLSVTQDLSQSRFFRLAARPPDQMENHPIPIPNPFASVSVPTYMYYLQRYLWNAPNPTETDLALRAIWDANPASRPLFQRALSNYLAVPLSQRCDSYDPDTVLMAAQWSNVLSSDFVATRFLATLPVWARGEDSTPIAPSQLTARNATAYNIESPYNLQYQIELNWHDNSIDEHGFRIYRLDTSSSAASPVLLTILGPNVTSYRDVLTAPPTAGHQFCYQVKAYRKSAYALADKPATIIESAPSNLACSDYDLAPPQLADSDHDGFPDIVDDCPGEGASPSVSVFTHGCRDDDYDEFVGYDENCPFEEGDHWAPSDTGPHPKLGCPIKYKLVWKKIELINNSQPFWGHDSSGKQLDLYGEGIEPYPFNTYGSAAEEPYLLFEYVNGMTCWGPLAKGTTHWGCGEGVDVALGFNTEPDGDDAGEEFPGNRPDLIANGLQIFPDSSPDPSDNFKPIDPSVGLIIAVTLMERDWTKKVSLSDNKNSMDAAVLSHLTAVAKTGIGCAVSLGIGCFAGIISTAIEDLFVNQQTPSVEVEDPDDYMGTQTWGIDRLEARDKTSKNGAYAFYFRIPSKVLLGCPTTYYGVCANPIVHTMQAYAYFVLYREGTPESAIQDACQSYQPAVPLSPWETY